MRRLQIDLPYSGQTELPPIVRLSILNAGQVTRDRSKLSCTHYELAHGELEQYQGVDLRETLRSHESMTVVLEEMSADDHLRHRYRSRLDPLANDRGDLLEEPRLLGKRSQYRAGSWSGSSAIRLSPPRIRACGFPALGSSRR